MVLNIIVSTIASGALVGVDVGMIDSRGVVAGGGIGVDVAFCVA
jgi:hypothetical protein